MSNPHVISEPDRESKIHPLEVESYDEMFRRVKEKNEGAFIPFIVAGDPDFDTSLEIVKTYVENGADGLEIGFAFSDPVADGPTVQTADIRALKSGITTDKGFEFIRKIREFTSIPIGLLVYYNLIYQKGIDEFYQTAKKSGVNAILAADLPPEEAYDALNASKKHGIQQIFMVAQTTSNERLEKISKICSGFLYVVAVMGVTGAREDIKFSTFELVERVKSHSNLPVVVGFGISKAEHVQNVIESGADGAIVASAILDMITENLNDKEIMLDKIGAFCHDLKAATKKTMI
ncbi:MAG: tryptophan synthase subunit alpha [Methanobacteriaceae archaeon]|nr:tryptophan synthase subunit alpha [Methanobacteriaceae archaeon]